MKLKLGKEITESRWKQDIYTIDLWGKPNNGIPCESLASFSQELFPIGSCLCHCFLICLYLCLCPWCPVTSEHSSLDLLLFVHHLWHVGKMGQQEVCVKPHKVASHMHTGDLQRRAEAKLRSDKNFSQKFGSNQGSR